MLPKLMVIAAIFATVGARADEPDTARANHLSLVTLNSESDCRLLLNTTIASQCLQSMQARKPFPITTEEYHQVMGGGKRPAPQDDPSSPSYNPTFNMGSKARSEDGESKNGFFIDEQTTESDSSGQKSRSITKNRSAYAIHQDLSSIGTALWISASVAVLWSIIGIVFVLK